MEDNLWLPINCLVEVACPNANQWQLRSGNKLNIFKREEKSLKNFSAFIEGKQFSEELAISSLVVHGRGKEIIYLVWILLFFRY